MTNGRTAATNMSLVQRGAHAAKLFVHRVGFDVTRDTFKHGFIVQLQAQGIDTVVDIGANSGQFAELLRRSGYTGRVHSVEPLSAAFDQLSAAASGDALWTVQRAAVSDEPGTITMNVSENSVSSSVLPMLDTHAVAAPSAQYVAHEEVSATTVDDIVASAGIVPERTMLKIDVQGYEKAVFDGATATLSRFAGVRTEMSLVPLYDGQCLMPELVDLLGRNGFDLWFIEPGFTQPGTRRLLQVDGVFFPRR
jgi:FkbM family methyltransferase